MEKAQKACMDKLERFSEETTLHGARNIMQSDVAIYRKVVWILILVACTAFGFVIIGRSVDDYLDFHTVTNVYPVLHDTMDFPSLLICNLNMARKDAVMDLYPELELFHQNYMNLVFSLAQNLSTNVNISNFDFGHSQLSDEVLMLLKNTTLSKYYTDVGHSLNQTFVGCYIGYHGDIISCEPSVKPHISNGLCYTFNSKEVNKERNSIKILKTGMEDGVGITLNVAPRQHYDGCCADQSFSYGYGFVVGIYDTKQVPNAMNRFFITQGKHSVVAIEKRVTKILSKPYADEECVDTEASKNEGYTREHCLHRCLAKLMYTTGQNCTCNPLAITGNKQCTLHDLYFCATPYMYLQYTRNTESKFCVCPYSCTSTMYDFTISALEYPNEVAVTLAEHNNWEFHNYSSMKENYASMHIYFKTFVETVTKQHPEMKLQDIFATIGGQLGLCVGASLITLVELLEFICILLPSTCQKFSKRGKRTAQDNSTMQK